MKPEWESYFQTVQITDLFYQQAVRIINLYEKIYPNGFTDVFISESIDKEGIRQYEGLWLFSDNFVMEAKDFLNKPYDIDSTSYLNKILYWNIKSQEFDFNKAIMSSRMALYWETKLKVQCRMKASQFNCDALYRIFLEYVLPNQIK